MTTQREIIALRMETLARRVEEDLAFERAKPEPCSRLTRALPYYIERLEYFAREVREGRA